MAELRVLKRKLDSVDSLREVVNAMRNLAAVYVRRAEASLAAIRPYTEIVETALRVVLERPHRAQADPDGRQLCLAVVFAGEQGLCGAYNERVVQAALAHKEQAGIPVEFAAIGRRARDLLLMRDVAPFLSVPSPTSLEGIRVQVPDLSADIFEAYAKLNATRMVFIYNDYEGLGRYREQVHPVLPPSLDQLGPGRMDRLRYEPILTTAPQEILGTLVEEYLFIRLCRALFESHCSENGARLLAMTAASRNIEDRFVELTKEFQTVRQDSITAELLDVVAGAEALRPA